MNTAIKELTGILALVALFDEDNRLSMDGKDFTKLVHGTASVLMKGPRSASYWLKVEPKCLVVEDHRLTVYSLTGCSVKKYFIIADGAVQFLRRVDRKHYPSLSLN